MSPTDMIDSALDADLDRLTGVLVDAFVEVHTVLGPGFKEIHYQEALAEELRLRGVGFREQEKVRVRYKGKLLSAPMRMDFLVEERVVVEIKAVDDLLPIHRAQTFRYVKAADLNVGLVVNFGAISIKGQIRRIAILPDAPSTPRTP